MIWGLIINLGILVVFKYTDFIISTINRLTNRNIDLVGLILPIGISFFTFQGMSYIIDIYRGNCKACFNPLDTALYISLFPQLIAGPIVKYSDIQPMIHSRCHSAELFAAGITRFVFGLSKKVLIANVLAETADKIFESLNTGLDTPSAWLGIICYTLQIYYDFSGYSDMAIGLGKMFGFNICENFNYPYISKSITEFWRRWHISLSGWFRDYVYIPLGGSRKGIRSVNLFITFMVTGLWHGASFNFILWGIWYGVILIIEKPLLKTKLYNCIPAFIKWFVTMSVIITGWVFFRLPDVPSAINYLGIMFGLGATPSSTIHFSYLFYIDNRLIFTIILAMLCSLPVWKSVVSRIESNTLTSVLRIPLVTILFIICIIYIVNNVYNPFIYFQF